jgi:hypothetical protein
MNVARLGNLSPHLDIPEWLVSKPVAVPYFDGRELTFTLAGFEDNDEADANAAVEAFLKLSAPDRVAASPHVFKNYKRIAELAEKQDLGCTITSEHDVWNHVHPSEVDVIGAIERSTFRLPPSAIGNVNMAYRSFIAEVHNCHG